MIVEMKPTEFLLSMIGESLRDDDKAEMLAVTGLGVDESLALLVHASPSALVGVQYREDEAYALGMFGIDEHRDGTASPWMIGCDALDDAGFEFARAAKERVEGWKASYPVMWNYVHAENSRAIEWLCELGFEVNEHAVNYGAKGELFRRFHCGGPINV